MGILDKAPETVRAWPSVEKTDADNYGRTYRAPGDEHVDIVGVFALPASVPTRSAARYSEDVAEGEIAFLGYTLVGLGLDVLDPQAVVEWPVGSGRMWDVQGHPAVHRYPPKFAGLASVRIVLREE